MIDDAIQFRDRFSEPPIGDPADLQELKDDLAIMSADGVKGTTLKLEDEVRSRIVTKRTLYAKPPKPSLFGLPDRKCPCCLNETPSCLAICLVCISEHWSIGKVQQTGPEGSGCNGELDRERIIKSAEEAASKAAEVIKKLSEEQKGQIDEED